MLEDTTIYEAAKYPWSNTARDLLKTLDVSLSEVDTNPRVIQRARERLLAALNPKTANNMHSEGSDEYVELTSFFVSKALVDSIGSMFLRRRWATFEAKRAEYFLQEETGAKLTSLAKHEFNWHIELEATRVAGRVFSHRLHFGNFLAATAGFHEREWKLINKRLISGDVLLRSSETTRVLRAAIEKLLLSDIKKVTSSFPSHIQKLYEEIESKVRSHTDRMQQQIQGEIVTEAFPPCMKALLADLKEGKPLPHTARFAITAFLLNVGMNVDSILDLFMKAPDFREDLARYQIEHIAGKRGSTAYTSPSCTYMVSVRLCTNPDEVERRRHPLAYYRRRRQFSSKQKSS